MPTQLFARWVCRRFHSLETRYLPLSTKGEFCLDRKKAVITGGGSGIGRAIALKFAGNVAAVTILDLNPNHAETVAKEIGSARGLASAYSCDVTDQQQVVSIFNRIAQESRIDILVNNAGISQIENVEATPEEAFDRIMRVNVKGYYNCLYACVGHMKRQGGGLSSTSRLLQAARALPIASAIRPAKVQSSR
jgi:NAD(P)-dependent dehydrogenase (short-subunit alcohol dehydrogenase family)